MKCINPIFIKNPCYTSEKHNVFNSGLYDELAGSSLGTISVPCGRCHACLHNKQNAWIFRMTKEIEFNKYPAFFFTLTYSDEYIPCTDLGLFTLVKKDLQDFFKRFRYHVDELMKKNQLDKYKVRYYASGEYGSQTRRPHYHVLLFDVPPWIQDYLIYLIKKSWTFCELEPQLIKVQNGKLVRYISKYISKKDEQDMYFFPRDRVSYINRHLSRGENQDLQEELNQILENEKEYQQRPFSLSSNRPPIGSTWFNRLTEDDKRAFVDAPYVVADGCTYSLPRFYKKKILSSFDSSLNLIKKEYRDMITPEFLRRANQAKVNAARLLSEYQISKKSTF